MLKLDAMKVARPVYIGEIICKNKKSKTDPSSFILFWYVLFSIFGVEYEVVF